MLIPTKTHILKNGKRIVHCLIEHESTIAEFLHSNNGIATVKTKCGQIKKCLSKHCYPANKEENLTFEK